MIQRTGAQTIVELLERQGVTIVPGIPGGANLPLYDALSRSKRIRHVLARHEQGAGFMAQGMARATGETSVCFATSGPGATNLITAIADAKLDSIPIVAITGQVPGSLIGSDAFQEVDTYGMSIPVTKHNFLVRSARELLRVIPDAFRIAASGRPGPVLIDVPKDVQTEVIEFESWPEPGRADPSPAVDALDVARAADMINESQRPVLYIGGGAVCSGAGEAIRRLAEKACIPTTMTLMGLGAIPVDHPLSLRMLGMHAARYTNMALEDCDLLIAAGVRFDDRATGKVAEFCPTAKVIHVDIDPSELDKIKSAHLGIEGDAREAVEALLPQVHKSGRTKWMDHVGRLKAAYPLVAAASGGPLSPHRLVRTISELLKRDACVATDVGQHQMWVAQVYPFNRPRQLLTSGGLGTMGFGLPAAIGAALAHPGDPVVCFTGDGSLLMNIQELATAAEEASNVKVVLMNNNSLGLVHQQQNLFYGNRIFGSDYVCHVDFLKVAEGFGVPAFDMGQPDSQHSALEQALSLDGPCLIHAPIDVGTQVLPMVPPGAANRDMIGGENGHTHHSVPQHAATVPA
ncbi:MAG: acetolactate synthase, large subunit, biosynthetic type [Armatimonadetes bacterium CG2_30_59_28]|nr:MAG: acetolactate synthase, large subunit, biosynthetic type [Armatimonadetes bacterium CG2_30_59_28]PIU63741.1 MAG: acetolactate synthase, large subunit, biosynthetic type [Armatimonadetes bacterium CG07_land_8_20_14_0_80_59_28]PIX41643.1 MAG: acetolactate synthase, large subunit, biosynthetic type [Armatimonadetes bacterium CG_4_8_14_3_um_filter_58_9]